MGITKHETAKARSFCHLPDYALRLYPILILWELRIFSFIILIFPLLSQTEKKEQMYSQVTNMLICP